MNVNKVIHEAMGLCNCMNHRFGDYTLPLCPKCLSPFTCTEDYPDYTDPIHYCALMDWMRGKWWALEGHLKCAAVIDRSKPYDLRRFFDRDRQYQVGLIGEAIEAGVFNNG